MATVSPVPSSLPRRRFTCKEKPQRPAHRLAVSLILPIALRWSGADCHALCQLPIQPGASVPETDIAIISGQPRDYADAHPTRTTKALVYAQGGIEEYWIFNLNVRTLEVRRGPQPGGYGSVQVFAESDSVAPRIAPEQPVRVADMLP